MKPRGLLSVIFYLNLAVVVTILGYRIYLYVSAPDATALLVHQIERIEADTPHSEPLSFAVIGEANNSIGMFEKQIIPRLNGSDISFMVSAGNIVSGGSEDKYRALIGTLSHLKKPYLMTFAQNEFEEFGSGRFYQRFGPHFYSVALDQVRLVFLDTTGRTPTDWQERWLRDVLGAESERPIIVFAGHPFLEPEVKSLFNSEPGAWSEPIARKRLLDLLKSLGTDLIVSAGAATYSDQIVDGIRHVVTGGAGGLVRNDETSFYHYLRVSVSSDEISIIPERMKTAPTPLARKLEGIWFFIYSLFYVGIWNFLLIFSGIVIVGVYLFNRLFRERQYYPTYRVNGHCELGRPMRVAMFTNSYLPFMGGVSISVSRLKAGLEQQGHEVRVICPSYGDDEADPTIVRVPTVFRFGNMMRLAHPLHFKTWRIIRDFDPDIIHLHHPFWLASFGMRMARRLKIPAVFTYHTRLEQFAHLVPLPGALFRNVMAHWIISRFANKCDQVIVPTPVTRDYIRLIGVTVPVQVHPTGVDIERFKVADQDVLSDLKNKVNPDHRLLLITVARLSKEKNIAFILRAMAELKRRDAPPFRLLVLGEGEEWVHLNTLIHDQDLTSEVEMLGMIPADEIPLYLNISDIFVFASLSETQGMVILEAMAAGLPVIAIQSSGIDAFVDDRKTGRVTSEDMFDWTNALLELMVNASERRAMSSAAKNAAQHHSIERFSSNIVSVYEEALAKTLR